jgi:hypothetical protein
VQAARESAVDAIHDQGHTKPQKHLRPVGAGRRHQREQSASRAASREDMHGKRGQHARRKILFT